MALGGSSPGVDQLELATGKIPDVARRQGGAARPGDGGDTRVGFGDRPSGAAPARADFCEFTSGGTVEGQYSACQILRENQIDNRRQGLPACAFRPQGHTVEHFQLGIAVVNSAEAGSGRVHSSTLVDGAGRKVSDKTFVSRMIM